MNCIQEELISVKYHEQTGQELFAETSDNQDPWIIIHNKQTPIESFINTITKIDFQRWYTNGIRAKFCLRTEWCYELEQ